MKELLVATSNPGKYREIMEVLSDLPLKFTFLGNLSISDEGLEESGATFAENALIKAKFFHEKTGMLTLAEDSGILVNALEGELGVKTRRWGAGGDASDEEWIEFFMKRMADEQDRRAKFVCCGCIYGEGVEEYFEGETPGMITDRLMAPLLSGLPLSSCFLADGREKVYAALSKEEKNDISHRGKAMVGVRGWLKFKAKQ